MVAQLVKNLPAVQETTCNEETWVRFLGWEDSPREGNDNPLQYSCLGNPMDRGASQATVHGVTRVGQNLAPKPPSLHICIHIFDMYIFYYIHILICIYFAMYTCIYINTHTKESHSLQVQ